MQKLTPFIWFEKDAKKAAQFYVKVFGGRSKIKDIRIIQDTPSGTVEVVSLDLSGQELTLMAAGPFRKINEAISFVVNCRTQEEVDHFWNGLSRGGSKGQCGWLKDRYGVSWQVVPTILTKLMADPDPVKAARVTQAMLTMTKLDIAKLKKAHKGAQLLQSRKPGASGSKDIENSRAVDAYILQFSMETQERLKKLRTLIKALAPAATEKISYRMPAFFLNGSLVWFAAFDNHIGFYPGASGVAAFESELSQFKHAKGSIQFPHNRPLPVALIKKIVKYRVKENLKTL